MILLCILAGLLTISMGYAAKWYLDRQQHHLHELDNWELALTSFVMCFLFIPLVAVVGKHAAVSNQVSYVESRGGWETAAVKYVTTCVEDGSCYHHYDCDPYECGEWVDDYDDKGHKTGSHYESRTCYHECPYCSEEWTFVVDTTLGPLTIADHNLPTDPDSWRWRLWKSVPSYLSSGVPEFWTSVQRRLLAGNPGPVTMRNNYPNYILASQDAVLRRFSTDVDHYLNAGLLPLIVRTKDVYARQADVRGGDQYQAYLLNRVYMVGVNVPGDWEEAINRFNAEFGSQSQGDLHLVIVDAGKVTNPDSYVMALMAYWEGQSFKKEALSKNAVVVVLGTTDGKTVTWARAATGMPLGNEHLVVQLVNELKGKNLDPKTLLGYPTASVVSDRQVQIKPAGSVLEQILMQDENKFKRVHMNGDDGKSGFRYLLNEIEPTFWQKVFLLIIMLFLSASAWGLTIRFGHELGQRLGLDIYRR